MNRIIFLMYQTDFICTYKMMDTADEQEQLYQIQFLQAFDLQSWNETEINNAIMELFYRTRTNDDFKKILQKAHDNTEFKQILDLLDLNKAGAANNDEDHNGVDEVDEVDDTDEIMFTLLFKYEYFDLLHRCICDFITNCEHVINAKLNVTFKNNLLNALSL